MQRRVEHNNHWPMQITHHYQNIINTGKNWKSKKVKQRVIHRFMFFLLAGKIISNVFVQILNFENFGLIYLLVSLHLFLQCWGGTFLQVVSKRSAAYVPQREPKIVPSSFPCKSENFKGWKYSFKSWDWKLFIYLLI